MSWLVKKLNFTVDLKEFEDYYTDLQNNYEHLRWDFRKCVTEVKQEWQDRISAHYGADRGYGWAIQSNLVDPNLPCPPYNISIHPKCEYRNTDMAKGLILKLQTALPYAYRWSLFVLMPGGNVPRHIDDNEEYTGHIPLFWDEQAVFEMGWDKDPVQTFIFPPGGVYLVNTLVPHATFNKSNVNRVGLVFRMKKADFDKVMLLEGKI